MGRECVIFPTIYLYLKELISNFTLVVLVHSMLSDPALIAFYVAIIVMVGYYTLCYWGEHGANVKAAAISKEIEKAERQFDLKMAESLFAIQASMARVEALIADLPFLSNHELMLLNLADKLLAALESTGVEAKLKAVSKMIEMIQLSGGRNSAGMVQSGVERDNDGAPSTPAGDVTPSSSDFKVEKCFGGTQGATDLNLTSQFTGLRDREGGSSITVIEREKNGFRLLHLQYYRRFTHYRSTIYNLMGCFDVSLLKPTFHPHLFPCPFALFKSFHVPAGRACAIFSTIYVYLKELISNFTLVVLVHSMLSEPALIAFYVAIIVMGEHSANVKAAAISKKIEKVERRFDLKMSVGLEAKLKAVSKMIEMIQLSGGHNSAGMVQSGVDATMTVLPPPLPVMLLHLVQRSRGREFHSRYREEKNGFRLLHLQYYRRFIHCRSTIYNLMGCCDVSLLKQTFHPHLFPCPFLLFKSSHVPVGRACVIFPTIYVYLKELVSNFTLVVLVHSMLSEPALIAFYVVIIVMVSYYTLCYWGKHRANVKAAVISKKIEKAERRFDLKMGESLLAIQASVARVEALITDRPFFSKNELMLLNLADKLFAAPQSVGLEAKLKVVSIMIEIIQSSGGRNSAGMVQSGVERDNDGAPSTPAGDFTPSSSGKGH
ncbi:hypothetical protein ACLOJK_016285 [Asimina triloba]